MRGKIDKYEVLRQLHETLKPSLYLEIGVQSGKSLALANCDAIGIDPMPTISVNLPKSAKIVSLTSDEFFAKHASHILQTPPGLVFIDGMYLFEYALRDFINVERYGSAATFVVIDDIFPNSKAQAARERVTQAWTGDVWKVFEILRQERPDLQLKAIDAFPTGVLLISGLDPLSKTLSEKYETLVRDFRKIEDIPREYVERVVATNLTLPKVIAEIIGS